MIRPHVITGSTEAREHMDRLQGLGWGRMFIDRRPRPWEGERWGFDNGAYTDWTHGRMFDEAVYQQRLDRAYKVGTPYMAVLPDVVAGGMQSLDYSLSWIDRVPKVWPWFLAVQDGMTPADVAPALASVSGIFLGGTNQFKRTAPEWARLAHDAGKLFHYARAGTKRKLVHAFMSQADSLDSTFFLWKRERFDAFERWWRGLPQLLEQQELFKR